MCGPHAIVLQYDYDRTVLADTETTYTRMVCIRNKDGVNSQVPCQREVPVNGGTQSKPQSKLQRTGRPGRRERE